MIWSYIIIFRPPEHRKHHLSPKWADLISSPFMYAWRDTLTYGEKNQNIVRGEKRQISCKSWTQRDPLEPMDHTVATIDSSNLHKYVHNPLCASGPHKMVLLLTNGQKYKQRWQSFEWPFRYFVSNYNILIDLSGCEFSPKAVGLRPQKLAQSSTSSPHLQLQPLTDWLYKDSEISPPTLSKINMVTSLFLYWIHL